MNPALLQQPLFQITLPLMVMFVLTVWAATWSQNKRFEDLRKDLDRRFDDVNRRFDDLHRRIDELRADMDRRFDEVFARLERIERKLDNHEERLVRL